VATSGCKAGGGHVVQPQTDNEPPRWRFERIEHGLGDLTLTGVYTRSDGTVFAVGWAGTIITNRKSPTNLKGAWIAMASHTTENLTAIAGTEDGAEFGLAAAEGEMFAVGWNGTVLHYHPNPDGDPLTDDGDWQILSAPGVGRFVGLLKSDPACPDFDGDGTPDDGDGDGFWGNAPCAAGLTSGCDDNCRTAANGPDRPIVDSNGDGCVGPGDAPPAAASWQADADGDGVGTVCDDTENASSPRPGFDADLFAVAVAQSGTTLTVVAAGGGGALLSYVGPDGSLPAATPAGFPVSDPRAWLAQQSLAFRYDDDCPAGWPAGTTCGNGRLPPSCPAMCNPRATTCDCTLGQCCDAAASTGAGCVDGSCGPAANACGADGVCLPFCPGCFRRLEQTLRGVAIDGDRVLVAGAGGAILEGSAQTPGGVWRAATCSPMPAPLDGRPVLTAVSGGGGSFEVVGAAGTTLAYTTDSCPFTPFDSGTAAFLSAVRATGGGWGYAVGDAGTLLQLQNGTVEPLDPRVTENLLAVTTSYDTTGLEWVWTVGAGGVLVRGAYY
jgi:hypothetical protein